MHGGLKPALEMTQIEGDRESQRQATMLLANMAANEENHEVRGVGGWRMW